MLAADALVDAGGRNAGVYSAHGGDQCEVQLATGGCFARGLVLLGEGAGGGASLIPSEPPL